MRPNHAIVVAAHGCSPFLERCLDSLAQQDGQPQIAISTSTPFPGLKTIAAKRGAHLHVHGPSRGIGADWNAALAASDAQLITIAHQDDVYDHAFSTVVRDAHAAFPDTAFSFTDADEILPDGSVRRGARNGYVKRALVAAAFTGSRVVLEGWRRRVLFGFGNPVICPSVTLNRRALTGFAFREDMRTNMDWLAWLQLTSLGGALRIRETLVHRRVHESSETASCIIDGSRNSEDAMIFDMLWPRPLARLIHSLYRAGYSGYLG